MVIRRFFTAVATAALLIGQGGGCAVRTNPTPAFYFEGFPPVSMILTEDVFTENAEPQPDHKQPIFGSRPMDSGTACIISPHRLLTAYHCIGLDRGRIVVDGFLTNYTRTPESRPEDDIAYLDLDPPLPYSYTTIGIDLDYLLSPGDDIFVLTRTASSEFRLTGVGTFTTVVLHGRVIPASHPQRPRSITVEFDHHAVKHGMSGSPCWARTPEGWRIIGVLSSNCQHLERGYQHTIIGR